MEELPGSRFINVLSNPKSGAQAKHIDKELLFQFTGDDDRYYYVCGPEKFTADMIEILHNLGIKDRQIVVEE